MQTWTSHRQPCHGSLSYLIFQDRLDAVSSLDNGSNKKMNAHPLHRLRAGEVGVVGAGNNRKSSNDDDLTRHHQALNQKPMMRIPMLIPQKRYPRNQYGGYADSMRRDGLATNRDCSRPSSEVMAILFQPVHSCAHLTKSCEALEDARHWNRKEQRRKVSLQPPRQRMTFGHAALGAVAAR